jgi:ribonucleoside-diphosphate reductase alpha chain
MQGLAEGLRTVSAPAAPIPFRNGRLQAAGLHEITQAWQCRKRDGSLVNFDPTKIRQAIRKCFKDPDCTSSSDATRHNEAMVEQIARAVVNTLYASNNTTPEVEDVQRLVVQQLWAAGLLDAAEHYQNYREQRRVARAAKQIKPDVAAQVEADSHHFPTDLQYFQFLGKFARWREADGRRETWRETCDRSMKWLTDLPLVRGKLTVGEQADLDSALYNLEASPAMRVVQMAGPALDRCNVGAYNCAYCPVVDLRSFAEILYILMQGSGCGFSVEADYVAQLPRVEKQKGEPVRRYVVEDDTVAWCDALLHGLTCWFAGEDTEFDLTHIRKEGARLKIKGGRASGPEPLRALLAFTRSLVLSRQGRYLSDLDCHDLVCMIGKIVQVGGVRRASEISLSDLDSPAMRGAKSGRWYETAGHRRMANNSAVYDEKPTPEVFMREWLSLIESKSGERGIFNRKACIDNRPARRKAAKFGCNPCAEIILRPFSFCNLSIVVARPNDTRASLRRKVWAATVFGMMQSTATKFDYLRPEWKQNAEDERLLGVDITGHADCPLLRYGAPGRDELLQELKQVVQDTKREFAPRFGINESAADTTVKPSGDSSVFFDCGAGISARFSRYQIRWVRESAKSPIAHFLKDAGVPWAVAPEDKALLVFGFPKQAPAMATMRDDLPALAQLENWLTWKTHWAEHSVSATIYVDTHEWLDVGHWVYNHFDLITGLSFLPKDNGVYTYAPNEELTREQYDEWVAKFPKLNWAKLQAYEDGDQTESAQTYACTGGACEL